jgi:hypothetical protein
MPHENGKMGHFETKKNWNLEFLVGNRPQKNAPCPIKLEKWGIS